MTSKAITFAAIKWGDKYHADYVNILFDMVCRNLPAGFAFSFVCFTDNAAGLMQGIETRPLPQGLTGWWNKLYLFKPGVFAEDERIFFLDLDTVITGDISHIANYRGEFAILRDFYNPSGLNSSLLLWRSGFGHQIWDSYEAAGRPDISGGDQAWIERCKLPVDLLQDLFPDEIVSFKDKAQLALPPGAHIVCFHGDPKPPRIRNGWVERVWKIGGEILAQEKTDTGPIENVRKAVVLPFPTLDTPQPLDQQRTLCIVGGGASAASYGDELKKRKQAGETIWAINGAFQWLMQQGIEPDAQIISSPSSDYAGFVPEQTSATLLYASQCHPRVFEKAAQSAKRVIMWHSLIDGIQEILNARKHNTTVISGGDTTGMRTVRLGQFMGFGNIHLFGFDSSFAEGKMPNTANEKIKVAVAGKSFDSTPPLAMQVNDFRLMSAALITRGVRLSLHGEGLLPFVARKLAGN